MANEVAKTNTAQLSNSELFANKVLKEFGQISADRFNVTDYQRQLIQGYFIQIDRALKTAEDNRLYKNGNNKDHKYDNPDPINWKTIDLNALAIDVMHYTKLGIDITQKNMIYAIPYKDNNRQCATGTKMYTVNLMPGYNGIAFMAEKYALDKPIAVTTELVYSTDVFKPIKKDKDNKTESYIFEVTNAFDRGKIVGGFGYLEFENPQKNKLIIMTLKDIEKRKPKYASAEFWGGKKKEWQNGKQVEVETGGWYEEMCLKTIKREVYSPKHIPIDPKKVDDDYQAVRVQELRLAQMEVQTIAAENTATVPLELPEPEAIEEAPAKEATAVATEPMQEPEPVQETLVAETGGEPF